MFAPVPLCDPPQLSCLLVGDLPGFPDECRLRDRRPSIDLLWEILAIKLSRVRGLIVRHGVPRSRQGNHDLTTLHFDVELASFSLGDVAARHRQASTEVSGCCRVAVAASIRTLAVGPDL